MKDETAELLMELALSDCSKENGAFREKHSEVIGQLLADKRYKDVTDLFFKQGFLNGMKFNSKMRKILGCILLITLTTTVFGQVKPRHYKIKYADTVNVYDTKTLIVIKKLKGGCKYITIDPKDSYTLHFANVVNMYATKSNLTIDTLEIQR